MTMLQSVVLATCYSIFLWNIIEPLRGPLRTKERKLSPIWQFMEGVYYFFFAFGTTVFGGIFLGCREFVLPSVGS